MSRFLLTLASAFGFCAVASAAPAETYTFEHVTVIDGRGSPPRPDTSVVVEGDRIASVIATRISPPARGVVIDGRGKYLIPGMIDAHIHLRGPVPGVKTDSRAAEAALASYIYEGFTTVADLGNQPEVILPMRAAERAGRIQAPRIFAAGNLLTYPGSKSDELAIRISDFEKDKGLLDQHIAEQQPDFLKLTYDENGWAGQPMQPLLPPALMGQIIQYYNARGIRALVHVTSERRSLEAIYAGADGLAHPVIQGPVSASFVKLMAAKKTPFATTLTIGDNYSRLVETPEFLDRADYATAFSAADRQVLRTAIRARYRGELLTAWRKLMLPTDEQNIVKIVNAGGVAALGTDQSSGAAAHREMQLLVMAGLKPAQVIQIATFNAAVFLGKSQELGSIEVGKLADLVLLNADPLAEIDSTEDIALVMKNGTVLDESRLPLAGGSQPRRYPGGGRPAHAASAAR
jgi:imidazolonepropionase-like amidohydrolase